MLKEGEKEMNEIIKKILDELFGIAFSGTVDSMKESKDQKKRIQEAESKLSQILESVKDEAYYDNLVQIISETRIIQDYFKRCITNKTDFGLSERSPSQILCKPPKQGVKKRNQTGGKTDDKKKTKRGRKRAQSKNTRAAAKQQHQ